MLNVDASFRASADSFFVGLVLHDRKGSFIIGRVVCSARASSALEAEAAAVYEGLSWLTSLPYQRVSIESDSKQFADDNYLKVGHILESCCTLFESNTGFSISFVNLRSLVIMLSMICCNIILQYISLVLIIILITELNYNTN